jgi:hypothetical protein
MPHRGKLYPITGINVYTIPIPELVEQLQHATNDETYKGESAETGQDTDLSTSKLSTSNQSNQSNVSSSSHSDTPTVVALHPIRDR